ncbi:MAG: hypothetical protein ACXAB7_10145 [Candidatus Kariarchaeaceae archaeon]
MSEDKIPSGSLNPYDLSNTNAFERFNSVTTSFTDGLENSIIELAKTKDKLLMSDVLNRFGNYPQVHDRVKRLLLENKLVRRELHAHSVETKKFDALELKIADPSLSKWVDLAAQPCLTCPIFNECAIENPVSPASCEEFEDWLQEEIQLEYQV